MRKTAKLLIAASIAAAACTVFLVVYLSAINAHAPYIIYRCLTAAESPLRCYRREPTAFRTTTFGMAYEGSTEDYIDSHILLFGAYEKSEMFFLRDVSTGGVFLDIGANKGLYSLFMAKYQKEIHAFDPYEPVLKKFRVLVESNGVRNIVIHPVGLGDKHERLTFEEPTSDNVGRGSFAWVSNNGPHEQLEIVKGDQALKEAGVTQVDLIKMDIEGFEQPALRGLSETLGRSRPIVLFELTLSSSKGPPVLFKSFDQISKAFPPGYNFLIFKHRDPYSGAYELGPADGVLNFNADGNQHNVIAFPSEKKDRIPLKGPIRK